MTLFLEIAKKFLIAQLDDLYEKSKAADKGFLNALGGVVCISRDQKISKKKRELIKALKSEVENFGILPVAESSELESMPSDLDSVNGLVQLIQRYKLAGATIAEEGQLPNEGSFGPGMQDLLSALDCIYFSLEKHRLVNIPKTNHPMNIFLYYAAYYFACKANNTRKMGVLESIGKNPQVSYAMELASKKENLLMEAITDCLSSLVDGTPLNMERRLVIMTIEALLVKNQRLCTDYGSKVDLPIRFSFFFSASVALPTFQPSPGDFEECMTQAKNEIEEMVLVPEQSVQLMASTSGVR